MKIRQLVLVVVMAICLLVMGGVVAPERINPLPDPSPDSSVALVVDALAQS